MLINMEFVITTENSKWTLTDSKGSHTVSKKNSIVCYLRKKYFPHKDHKYCLNLVNRIISDNTNSAYNFNDDQKELLRLQEVENKYESLKKYLHKTRQYKLESEYINIYSIKSSTDPEVITNIMKTIDKHFLKGYDTANKWIQNNTTCWMNNDADRMFYTRYLNRIYYKNITNECDIKPPKLLTPTGKNPKQDVLPLKPKIREFNLEIYIENINTAYSNVIEINPKKYDSDKLWKYESNELGTFKDLIIEDTLDKCILEKLISYEKELKWTNTLELFIVKFKELQN